MSFLGESVVALGPTVAVTASYLLSRRERRATDRKVAEVHSIVNGQHDALQALSDERLGRIEVLEQDRHDTLQATADKSSDRVDALEQEARDA